jgi:ABC-type sugar transport system ATPase subunit
MAQLELDRLGKTFGAVEALSGITLEVAKGEFCALLGPSGCGKSTLLRLIAGLEDATSGAVRIAGRDVTDLEPADRGIAMVFQSYALYPHMTVAENIAFSLEAAGRPKSERLARAAEVARLLHLDALLDRRPSMLSGGQRQRVAIGRALVRDPQVFLFDEPLSNLDAMLRVQMRIELSNLHRDLAATIVYVTHDQVEAMTMADRIVVMDRGRIQQIGAPLDLYNRPANRFVATFIGSPSMNILALATASATADGQVRLRVSGGLAEVAVPLRGAQGGGQATELGIRPEHLRMTEAGAEGAILPGTVRLVERLGDQTLVHLQTPAGPVVLQGGGEMAARLGQTCGLAIEAARAHVFGADGAVL